MKRPTLDPKNRIYIDGFWVLHASRDSNGYGPNPIRITEIAAFLQLAGISGQEGLKFLRLIQVLDEAFVEHYRKKNNNK